MTGAGLAGAACGVQMFSLRQFSLPSVTVLAGGLTTAHGVAAMVAFNVAGAHGAAACGGFHRRLPVGGVANGIPRKAHDVPRSTPCTAPLNVIARHDAVCVVAGREAKSRTPNIVAITNAAVAKRTFIETPPAEAARCRPSSGSAT